MPRITVVAKIYIGPEDELNLPNPPARDFQWAKKCIPSEDIWDFEEYTETKTLITRGNGTILIIKEKFDDFEARIHELEDWKDNESGEEGIIIFTADEEEES